MAEMIPKAAQIMTIAGAVDCLIAIVIMIFIFLGRSSLPILIPTLLLIIGILIVIFSLAYHTGK
ncbi:MAG: hypothetical protein ABI686_11235 [Acidobacteriota bacterium]